jgi:hypothetical protein
MRYHGVWRAAKTLNGRRWSELVGVKEGQEMHVEQRGQGPDGRTTILKIRYYDIQPYALQQVKQGDAKSVCRAGMSHLGSPVRRSRRELPEIVHRFLTAGTSSGATIFG